MVRVVHFVVFLLTISWTLEYSMDQNVTEAFEDFIKTEGRHYKNASEKAMRFQIFNATYQHIKIHNEKFKKGLKKHELGLNERADLTKEEINAELVTFPPENENDTTPVHKIIGPPRRGKRSYTVFGYPIYDWRDYSTSVIPPVRSQGGCGCCWACAAMDLIASHYAIQQSAEVWPISVQEAVDCIPCSLIKRKDCTGAVLNGCTSNMNNSPMQAYQYVLKYGAVTEEAYPYKKTFSGSCRRNDGDAYTLYSGSSPGVRMTTYKAAVDALYNIGPVSVSIDARCPEFANHKSGIIADSSCKKAHNHVVMIVGFGYDGATSYYIIKNSWGTSWGEKGFAKVKYNDLNGGRWTYPTL